MHSAQLKILTGPTLLWLKQSFEACNGNGSAAWNSRIRRPFSGWSDAYPETTGYIIETLLDYFEIYSEDWMHHYALSAADWLIGIQRSDGSFPGGLGTEGPPSIFNSGMILFGLERAYVFSKQEKYFDHAKKTAEWLCNMLDDEGKWSGAAYVKGYIPSYYTRVIWAVLKFNQHKQDEVMTQKMKLAYRYYCQKFLSENSAKDWSFEPGKPAFTHTIAYTMRGFIESATLLNDRTGIEIAEKIAEQLNTELKKMGAVAGSYDENWNGDYSFTCVTGNAQLSVNFFRLFELTNSEMYRNTSKALFETVKNAASSFPMKGIRGGIPGSFPFWGKYMPLQYINWAAKFWLDAARLMYVE